MREKVEKRIAELEQARVSVLGQLNAIEGALMELKNALIEDVAQPIAQREVPEK